MIPELWDYLTTTANKEARKNGYLYQSIALAHRAKRCRSHWLGHLQKCHELLNQKLPGLESGSRVAVLGSGLMLETPAEILAQHFEKIDLIDVVHTKDVRQVIHQYSVGTNKAHKFRFIERDLNEHELPGEYDFVISANLLSQVGLVRSQAMRKKKASPPEIQEMNFELQEKHLTQIKNLSDKFIIISDYQMRVVDLIGEVAETSETVDPRLKISWNQTWNWNLAPVPELSKEFSVELFVGTLEHL